MELKTKVHAEDGRQDLQITREFDLPLELLFRAYSEPALVEQWMGTKVLKQENKKHGGWQIETKDKQGNVIFSAGGVIHAFIPEQKITRTFEMDNAGVGVQLEIYTFEALTADTSRLQVHVIYESAGQRDQVMQFGFVKGLNMAHKRLEEVAGPLRQAH